MEYMYLFFAVLLYFPLILADKLGSEGTEQKAMLFKYSFYRSLAGVVFGGIILLFTANASSVTLHIDLYTVLTSLMFGLMLGLCMLVTFYSMQVTTVAISSVFKAASIIIPCIFGAWFFDESISIINIIGIILFLISVYLIVSINGEKKVKFGLKALLACLGVLFTNGFGSIAIQLFGKCVPNGVEALFMFISYCVQSVVLLVIHLFYRIRDKTDSNNRISKKMWIYGIIGTAAAFLIQQIMAVLSSDISAIVIFPITMGSSIIIGVIIGWMWFKEKLTFKSALGVLGTIVSLMLINMF